MATTPPSGPLPPGTHRSAFRGPLFCQREDIVIRRAGGIDDAKKPFEIWAFAEPLPCTSIHAASRPTAIMRTILAGRSLNTHPAIGVDGRHDGP